MEAPLYMCEGVTMVELGMKRARPCGPTPAASCCGQPLRCRGTACSCTASGCRTAGTVRRLRCRCAATGRWRWSWTSTRVVDALAQAPSTDVDAVPLDGSCQVSHLRLPTNNYRSFHGGVSWEAVPIPWTQPVVGTGGTDYGELTVLNSRIFLALAVDLNNILYSAGAYSRDGSMQTRLDNCAVTSRRERSICCTASIYALLTDARHTPAVH